MASSEPGRQMLLTIPPELRNRIYHLIAKNVKKIKMDPCKQIAGDILALQDHPLSLISRQLRKEFRPVYAALAPQVATRIELRITNFALMDIFAFVPANNEAETTTGASKRKIVVYVTLTPTVFRTLESLAMYLHHVRDQGQAQGSLMRSLRHPTFSDTPGKSFSVRLRYRVALKLDARDLLNCLEELNALRKLVTDGHLSSREWSQIMDAFHYAAGKRLKGIQAIRDQATDDARHLRQINNSLAQRRKNKI